MKKEPYELSVWEDILVPATDQVPEYFNEKKIAIIGSHDFDAPLRAHNVSLKENINGEKTLTFNMLRKIKNENGELVDNPLSKLLTNECKLKLRDGEAYPFLDLITNPDLEDNDERWSDFVIKNIDEDKSSYLNTYTAKELFVNELGKNGWAVTLDTELENNFGTIKELGAAVLEGSDWTVSADSYSPTEKIAEPLFKATLTTQLSGTYVLSGTPVTLAVGKIIYPLYNSVEWDSVNSIWKFKDGEVQFLYADKEFTLDDADDNRIIIDNTLAFNITTETAPTVASIILTGVSQTEALQGYRIIKTQDNRYESVLDQYVKEFEVNNVDSGAPIGTKVYGYTKTDYITPTLLKNLLTNYSNFTATTAWSGSEVATRLFPLPTSGTPADWLNTRIFSYLALDCSSAKGYLNEGPQFAKLALIKDNVYVLRMKARWVAKNTTEGITNISSTNLATIKASIRKEGSTSELSSVRTITTTSLNTAADMATKGYALANTDARTPYSVGATNVYRDANQYIYVYLVATETTDVETDNLRLYLTNTTNNATHDFCIEDIQLFEYKEDSAGVPIFFGDTPEATIKETPMFYQIVNEEARFLSSNTSYYTPLYKSNYESVRSISIKESNYFNNIQSLAELFEVWVRFKTYHTQDGKLLFVNGLPKKEVIFSQFAPNGETVNQAGFKYGVNLQSIKRTVDSDSIATKVIVKNNNQQYAVDGMASISRAHSNPSGENEIYNFNYYINQGLLEYNQVLADLYGLTSTDLAFLVKLRQYNDEYNNQSKLVISYSNELMLSESEITLYQTQIASINDELLYLTNLMESYAEIDDNYQTAKIAAEQITAKKQAYQLALSATQSRYNAYKVLYDAAQVATEAARTSKQTLKLQFYKKYYRFIQEGTWTDEKYVDDELYFLDAMKVAGVSSFPKVSYSIGVLDISRVTGYEGYAFKIGQRTYVEDPEFFGYVYKTVTDLGGNIKTPFRQEVIIAEHSRNFDDASKSTITVKNYKNQFEELFQKITATTQALQYESGAYGRAAAAIMPTGEIDISTLEKSFSNNAFILSNSNNQNVIWDSSIGIEIINNENSSERLRLVAGGIFLSTDAGKTWKSGITGAGINTRYLLAGQIDTSKITIVNGTVPYFRWDKDGLNAFSVSGNSYDLTKFVRFNQYGLFGTTNGLDLELAVEAAATYDDKLAAVKQYSNFSLTWDGLFLQIQDGAVSLDPLDGLEVFGPYTFSQDILNTYDRVIDPSKNPYVVGDKIPLAALGKYYEYIGDTEPRYGLRLRNKEGYVTLATDDDGNLWMSNLLSVGGLNPYNIVETITDDVLLTRGATLTFEIGETEIPTAGTLSLEETGISYGYTSSDYTLSGGIYYFSIPANSFDSGGTVITTEVYSMSYPIIARQAYRYLGIDGEITDPNTDPTILYAGHYEPDLSSFQVSASGILRAYDADITGVIRARSGEFTGEILVGSYSGISGDMDDQYTLWAGFTSGITREIAVTYVPNSPSRATFTLSGVPTELFYRGIIVNHSNSNSVEFSINNYTIVGDDYNFNVIAEDLGISTSGVYELEFISRNPNFYVTPSGKLFAQNVEIYGSGIFSGTVYATDGSFSGSIHATSGSITGQLFFGLGTNSYIGYTDEDHSIISIENGNFEVGAQGNVFANTLFLSYNETWGQMEPITRNQMYNILIGDEGQENFVLEIFDPSSQDIPQKDIVFGVRNDGSVLINGTLTTAGDLIFSGIMKASNITIDGLAGEITSKTPSLDGWGIFEDGSAIFQNVDIRGKISSAIFEYDSISSVGGSLLVSPSVMLVVDIPLAEGIFDIAAQVSNNLQVWQQVDNVTINIVTPEGRFVYRNVVIEDAKITPSIEMTGITVLPIGTQIISTSTRTNSILLSAEEVYGPTISMIGATEGGESPSIVVIGNLNSYSVPSTIFASVSGYGLYADNAYLTGQLYLPNAGVTNEETEYDPENAFTVPDEVEDKRIRFWAGTSPSEKHHAPFAVTQDGRLYATSGVFKGVVEAEYSTFSGELKAAGILIDDRDGSTSHNHFYVAWPYEDNPSPESYILNIDRNGLSIWEGGLQIYSDYYSGWRIGDTTTPSGPINPYYGYEAGENENPYPIFKVRDISDSANLVPRISQVHTHFWFKQSNIAYSTRVSPGLIDFGSYPITLQTSSDYAVLEDLIYNSADRKLLIGLTSAADQKYGLKSNSTISISGDFTDAFRFTPGYSFDEEENMINTSVSQVEGIFKFGEVVQITQEPDGLVFTYIGTDE